MFVNDQQSQSLILPFTQQLAQSQRSDISENLHDHKRSYVLNQVKISGYSLSDANSQYLLIDSSYEDNLMLSNLTQKLLTQEFKSRKGNNFQMPRHLKTMSNPFQNQNLVLCNICFDSSDVMKMQSCEHSFCQQCVKQYLQNKIYIGSVIDIKCPELLCKHKLEDEFIKYHLDSQTYKKFQKFKRIKEKEHITNGKWCPSPDCENFVIKQNSSNTLLCPCGQKFCFLCGNFDHPKQNCQDAQDILFKEALKNYSIYQCPKCQANIQKNLGCNHMTCYKCQYEFCWLCKSAYTSKHYDCMNPFSCPGSQGSDREPFKYPKLLMGLQATFKITMYILAAPLIATFCLGLLLYWILIYSVKLIL